MPSLISPLTAGPIDRALEALINTTSGAGVDGNAEEPRAAMVFTSRLRMRELADFIDRNETLRLLAQGSPGVGLQVNPGLLFDAEAREQDLSNQLDKRSTRPTIVMAVNPHSVSFEQPKRYTRQDTMRGSVFHHFTNSKGQNNDILTIRFEGNTGNISRRGRTQDDRDRGIERLKIWHNLYQLTREPMLLSDGTANTFTISYQSALFPVQIDFRGFFTKVLTFSENAQRPNSRDYSMEFIVQDTSPDLDTVISSILDFVTQQAVATPNQESKVLGSF